MLKYNEDHSIAIGTYIVFAEAETVSKKTKRWAVITKNTFNTGNERFLGIVKWFSSWRSYSFAPFEETIFEQTCLEEIAEFISHQTKRHKLNIR